MHHCFQSRKKNWQVFRGKVFDMVECYFAPPLRHGGLCRSLWAVSVGVGSARLDSRGFHSTGHGPHVPPHLHGAFLSSPQGANLTRIDPRAAPGYRGVTHSGCTRLLRERDRIQLEELARPSPTAQGWQGMLRVGEDLRRTMQTALFHRSVRLTE